jgi:hypothetical protein
MYRQAGGKEKRGREKARLAAAVARRRGKSDILKRKQKKAGWPGRLRVAIKGRSTTCRRKKKHPRCKEPKTREGKRGEEKQGASREQDARQEKKYPRYTT